MRPFVLISTVLFALAFAPVWSQSDSVDVRVVSDEADSALAVISRVAGAPPDARADVAPLLATAGYGHLKEREAGMGRPFSDSEFVAFLRSPDMTTRVGEYRSAVEKLESAKMESAAALALAYLPPHTPLHARLYLEIKPHPNSFVFTGADSVPSIFLAVEPDVSPQQAKNTLAHELHHIGVNAACRGEPWANSTRVTPAVGMLLEYLTAFGEGRAMLAAAGGVDVHPHAADPDSVRKRWDRDVAHAPADIAELSGFATDVLDGRIATADSVRTRGNSYFGVQGPWYTVGWLMASTVERAAGRKALIGTLCDPVAFLSSYNTAAARLNSARAQLPVWPPALVARLTKMSAAVAAGRGPR